MQNWRSKYFIFAAIVVGLPLCIFFLLPLFPQQTTHTRTSLLRDEIRKSIQEFGPTVAYADFKRFVQQKDLDAQHNAAHIFGESLYETHEREGVATCDSELNFGCYHGFFTAAVKTEGLAIVTALDDVCQSSLVPSACQHGLGHGILEYLGHKKLTEALLVCGQTTQPDPIAGCTSGVFMEYNVPLIIEGDTYSTAARPLGNPEQPYGPCMDVDEVYRTSCFHELPQWWHQVYNGSYERMGELCDAVSDPKQRRSCFAGVGNITGNVANYDVNEAIQLCMKVPKRGRDTCLISAAWSFTIGVESIKDVSGMCEAVSESLRETCIHSL